MPSHQEVADKIDAIERELRRIGAWQSAPLDAERYDFREAFAMDTMAFTQWLQFIFIERVRSLITSGGAFPRSSQVGVQAVRELDGQAEAADLIRLLNEFDELFG
jgi:uncharacterized protein YqcC (DUF446 family)